MKEGYPQRTEIPYNRTCMAIGVSDSRRRRWATANVTFLGSFEERSPSRMHMLKGIHGSGGGTVSVRYRHHGDGMVGFMRLWNGL